MARAFQKCSSKRSVLLVHWEIKGRFRKRVVLANVPSFRLSFRGNIRRNHPFGNHPFVNTKKAHWEIRGRFRKRVVLTNVPLFRFSFRGNIRRNHPFGNHPFGISGFGSGFLAYINTSKITANNSLAMLFCNDFVSEGSVTHRVVQGAAQTGAQFYFNCAVLRTVFFMQPKEPFLP